MDYICDVKYILYKKVFSCILGVSSPYLALGLFLFFRFALPYRVLASFLHCLYTYFFSSIVLLSRIVLPLCLAVLPLRCFLYLIFCCCFFLCFVRYTYFSLFHLADTSQSFWFSFLPYVSCSEQFWVKSP